MERFKRAFTWFLRIAVKEAVGNLLVHYLHTVGGGVILVGVVSFLLWLANIPWPIFIVIAIVTGLLGAVWIDHRRSGLKIRFCTDNGTFIKHAPEARFWKWGTGSICYYVYGFFRLSNIGTKERTLEDAYVILAAKGNELMRVKVSQFPSGGVYTHLIQRRFP